jgi:hypothetical protein
LKSRNVSGFKKQLHSSHAFVDYLCSLVKRFGDSDMSGFKRRSVLFTTRAFANKRPIMHNPPYKGPMGDETLIEFFCKPNKRDVPSYPVKLLLGLN